MLKLQASSSGLCVYIKKKHFYRVFHQSLAVQHGKKKKTLTLNIFLKAFLLQKKYSMSLWNKAPLQYLESIEFYDVLRDHGAEKKEKEKFKYA